MKIKLLLLLSLLHVSVFAQLHQKDVWGNLLRLSPAKAASYSVSDLVKAYNAGKHGSKSNNSSLRSSSAAPARLIAESYYHYNGSVFVPDPGADSVLYSYSGSRGGTPLTAIQFDTEMTQCTQTGTDYSMYQQTYDAGNNNIYQLLQYRDSISNVWVNSTQQYNYYLLPGSYYLGYMEQVWNPSTTNWQNVQKDSIYLNSANNDSVALTMTWNTSWTNSTKYLYYYNDLLMDSAVVYDWDTTASTWSPTAKYLYGYDMWGNIDTIITQYYNSGWVNSQRETFVYISNGIYTSELLESYTGTTWANQYQLLYNYTGTHLLSEIQIPWNIAGSLTWDTSSKYEFTYNADSLPTMQTAYTWSASGWYIPTDNFRYYYYYQSTTGTPQVSYTAFSVNAFPNPATGTVTFAYPKQNSINIGLKDVTGRTVAFQQLQNSASTTFDVRQLPPGLYLYDATTGTETQSGKIVIGK